MANKGFTTGKFIPRNPGKYRGDVNKITYRSSWELSFCRYLDNNSNVLEWASEEISIPYIKPTTQRVHKYYPDFWIKFKNKDGEIRQEIIEVKPDAQTRAPKKVGKRKNQQLYEQITYAINIEKWKAATLFCNKYNMKFRLLTEKEMFR